MHMNVTDPILNKYTVDIPVKISMNHVKQLTPSEQIRQQRSHAGCLCYIQGGLSYVQESPGCVQEQYQSLLDLII
jgi:hypothetical protein